MEYSIPTHRKREILTSLIRRNEGAIFGLSAFLNIDPSELNESWEPSGETGANFNLMVALKGHITRVTLLQNELDKIA